MAKTSPLLFKDMTWSPKYELNNTSCLELNNVFQWLDFPLLPNWFRYEIALVVEFFDDGPLVDISVLIEGPNVAWCKSDCFDVLLKQPYAFSLTISVVLVEIGVYGMLLPDVQLIFTIDACLVMLAEVQLDDIRREIINLLGVEVEELQ